MKDTIEIKFPISKQLISLVILVIVFYLIFSNILLSIITTLLVFYFISFFFTVSFILTKEKFIAIYPYRPFLRRVSLDTKKISNILLLRGTGGKFNTPEIIIKYFKDGKESKKVIAFLMPAWKDFLILKKYVDTLKQTND